ncbi:MAG: hypothetical protein GY851_15365 [bacterium]|nr:hypothetical protein [bacterium]
MAMKSFSYKDAKTREISFPLGGIGSGCVGLSGTGHLVDWETFNRPAKGSRNGFSHFAIKAEARGKLLDARAMHGDVPPPFSGMGAGQYGGFGFGVARETLSGLPHFKRTEFLGGFPFAEVRFRDPDFPGHVSLTAFNPFIPLNDRDSSIPAAFFTVTVRNTARRAIDYTVAFTVRNPASGATSNRLRRKGQSRFLHLTGDLDPADVDYGDFAIASDADQVDAQAYWYRGQWFDNLGVYWQDFAQPGVLPARTYRTAGTGDHGTLSARLWVPAGGTATARFVLTWNVPNCHNYWKESCGCGTAACKPQTWKNYYATQFKDAADSATYCLTNWDRLERETRLFRDTLFRSTLPAPVLDAVSANISVLKTPTCLRLEDGSFYGWEGCHAESGCCEGSCTHVWNYAYALPFLFPALERSMRELDYRHNLRPDGGMSFRLQLPLGSERSEFRPCVDGQLGGVLKVYREWKICGDTSWLRRLWPDVRKSIEFAWAPTNEDRWDPDKSGVVQGRQHHTLDMELFGPNAWLTGFYLAALKAGAEMAEACDDMETAASFRVIFERGREWIARHLFNGDYFIQRIGLNDRSLLKPFKKDGAIQDTYWSDEHGELKYQVGEGCGIDQVLAQWHADLIGLGDVFDRKQTRRALRAIHRHNFRPTMRGVFNPCRLYCLDDEAGTTMFAWPKGARKPVVPIPYAEETMHGFEYQAACHLILNGMVDRGVAMVKAVRDRYDGERRNPWNEIECGSNYARSMASYALLNAFSGFQFDMVRQEIGFHPVQTVDEGFRCFWSLESAWGEVDMSPNDTTLRVRYGELMLKSIALPLSRGDVSATLKGRRVPCTRGKGVVRFDSPVTIPADAVLRVKAASR